MTTRIEVFDDADALATSVAGELLHRLVAAQERGEVPHVGLTGGGIAERIHRAVARLAPDSGVDWARVVLWWGDERYVAADSDDRNAARARSDLLDRIALEPGNVHEAPATDSGLPLAEAAAAYGEEIRTHGGGAFEVLMLGIGPDGHVASLFPGHPALDVAGQVAVAVEQSPKPPPERISLTFEALNRSRSTWFVASGEEKADAVRRALADEGDLHDTPARGIRGDITWFLDRPAASHL